MALFTTFTVWWNFGWRTLVIDVYSLFRYVRFLLKGLQQVCHQREFTLINALQSNEEKLEDIWAKLRASNSLIWAKYEYSWQLSLVINYLYIPFELQDFFRPFNNFTYHFAFKIHSDLRSLIKLRLTSTQYLVLPRHVLWHKRLIVLLQHRHSPIATL